MTGTNQDMDTWADRLVADVDPDKQLLFNTANAIRPPRIPEDLDAEMANVAPGISEGQVEQNNDAKMDDVGILSEGFKLSDYWAEGALAVAIVSILGYIYAERRQ